MQKVDKTTEIKHLSFPFGKHPGTLILTVKPYGYFPTKKVVKRRRKYNEFYTFNIHD